MISNLATVALYVDDEQQAVDFWTKRVGFEVRSRRPLGSAGNWIEIAPPGAETCLVIFPRTLLSDWAERKPSIVFACDDVRETVANLKDRGVRISQEPKDMEWGPFAAFVDPDGNEHGLREVAVSERGASDHSEGAFA